jgi:predicted nucleic acid-binding protein
MPRTEIFLDTAYAIALSSSGDEHHEKALFLADQLETDGTKLITTRAIMLEIGNALSKQPHRQAAVELLESLEQDPSVEIIPLTEELYKQAFELYQQRPDKEWGMTDCISFIVMSERNLQEALTTDKHFQQAGYKALLRATQEGV